MSVGRGLCSRVCGLRGPGVPSAALTCGLDALLLVVSGAWTRRPWGGAAGTACSCTRDVGSPVSPQPPSSAGDMKSEPRKQTENCSGPPEPVRRRLLGPGPRGGCPAPSGLLQGGEVSDGPENPKGLATQPETSFKRKLLHFALHLEINVGSSIFIAHLMDEVLPPPLPLGPTRAMV